MFEELETYLINITTPENVAVLQQSYTLLEQAGWLSQESDMWAILNSVEDYPTETNLSEIWGVIDQYLRTSLEEFGVFLTDTAHLSQLNRMLSALMIVEDYGDPQAILLAVGDEELSVEEKLCAVVRIIHADSQPDLESIVESVTPTLIEGIQIATVRLSGPEEDWVDVSAYRERFAPFRQRYPNTLGEQAVHNGFGLGSSWEVLVQHYNSELEVLEKDPATLTQAIVGLLLVSDTPHDKLLERSQLLLEDYALDINLVTKAQDNLMRLLKEFG